MQDSMSRTITPTIRTTRSGKTFADWSGSQVPTPNPAFDFEKLLLDSIIRDSEGLDVEVHDIFGPSPLSTPESTPPSSPKASTSALPAPDSSPPLYPDAADPPEGSGYDGPSQSPSPAETPSPCAERTNPSEEATQARKVRMRRKKHAYRRNQRIREKEEGLGGHEARPQVVEKYVDGATPIPTPMVASSASVASTGFVALDDRQRHAITYSLHQLVGPDSQFKFRLQEWDGRTPMPIVDRQNRVIAVLAGHPPDDDWAGHHRRAADALENARQKCSVPHKAQVHRRGTFTTLRCGVSHGGGQTKPSNVSNNAKNSQVLEELNNHDVFKRLAGFASSVLATWVPGLYYYYLERLGTLFANDHTLQRTFLSWIFAATTYNLGPRTTCYPHRDFANLPFGWCAVTALGTFNPKKGGHMVLWDCHLVIEFPPGSTILLPSAIVSHSNAAIAKAERRYSSTQYVAGALFRWVENGFQKSTEFISSLTEREKEIRAKDNAQRFEYGLSLFPILDR